MRWLTCLVFLWTALFASCSVQAEDDLEKAHSLFKTTQAKQAEQLEAAFERKMKEATKVGDLDLVKEMTAEHEEFARSGKPPTSSAMKILGMKYSKALDQAEEKLKKFYEAKIKSLTRAGQIDEAQSMQSKLDALVAADFSDKPRSTETPSAPLADNGNTSGATNLVPVAEGAYDRLPERVRVLPIAFIPQGQQPPTDEEQDLFVRHLKWTQKRYGELLGGDTFEFAESPPRMKIIPGRRTLDDYRNAQEGGAPLIVVEILDELKLNRFENPYIFAILLMNSVDRFPAGGGRPINGGINGGGGMFYIASGELRANEHFQCTLQHELGHSFGLSHADAYGYDQMNNASMMSYNPAHHNHGLRPSPTPGIFVPEDRRALALNDRAFANTGFDIEKNVPKKGKLYRYVVPLPPMELPGHPNFYPTATTNAGEEGGSKADRCLWGYIRPSEPPDPGKIHNFDPGNMWHTTHDLTIPVALLDITFPFPVEIDGLGIHTHHSAMDHQATHAKFFATDEAAVVLADSPLDEHDDAIDFSPTKSRHWRLELTPGPSKTIVVRGIRFLHEGKEIYPRMAPYGPLKSIP